MGGIVCVDVRVIPPYASTLSDFSVVEPIYRMFDELLEAGKDAKISKVGCKLAPSQTRSRRTVVRVVTCTARRTIESVRI